MQTSNSAGVPAAAEVLSAAGGRHSPLFDELRWVIHIRSLLSTDGGGDDDDDDDSGIAVSVFNVPKPLLAARPEAYVPQLIAVGPYHHWRPELYEMERYKLAAAKRTQKHFRAAEFRLQQLVEQFVKVEHKIRAHYHRYLDFNGETLAWMMVVDGAFLLEFLQIYAIDDDEDKALKRVSSRMAHLVDFAGRKSAHNSILRDSIMLENQIPLFLLRKILDLQCASAQDSNNLLDRMLAGYVKELCPFKMMESFASIDSTKHAHILELLYYILVPESDKSDDTAVEIEEQNDATEPNEQTYGGNSNSSYVKQLFDTVWNFTLGLNGRPIQYVKQVIVSRPIQFIVKAPWNILTSLPGLSVLKQPVEYLFFSSQSEENSKQEDPTSSHNINKPPLVEEITIPSVSELVDVGVKFSPTKGDIHTISFDVMTATFYLPTISLDINTGVILRNLVAYEASTASGPLVFTRYTELMNGIIDTEEDVMLLRQSGVLVNRMKSDRDVANLWNGMSKSIRLTKVSFLDKAIEDVNKYYNSRWRVKTKMFTKKYVFGSWQFLTLLAAIPMLLLTTLQAFCSVYTCSRFFGVVNVVKQ
ncbi:putative UPF0481 protein At3g02645 [Ananas comosus]|uniref:UPF0481 protein At3g02645 n=1 Tax=Ananas comosus TaxID=4615 RepID=A0A6P5FA44_ANACO|nr:putative UPF0481 protein At3g02645 [Ananas comosus]